MVTPESCPNCGAALAAGATTCASCGHALVSGAGTPDPASEPTVQMPTTASESGAAPRSTEPQVQSSARIAGAEPAPAFNIDFSEMRERWGVQNSGAMAAGLILAVLAIAVATFALLSQLLADETEFLQRTHADIWGNSGMVMVIAALAVLVLVRVSSTAPAAASSRSDLYVGLAFGGVAAISAALCVILGLSERLNSSQAWIAYAQVWALVTAGWFCLSRPVPPQATTGVSAETVGWILVGLAIVLGLVGLIIGQGDDIFNDEIDNYGGDYLSGASILQAGIVSGLLAFAWFLGMRKAPT